MLAAKATLDALIKAVTYGVDQRRAGECTATEFAAKLGVHENTARRMLRRAESEGSVLSRKIREGGRVWRVWTVK